MRNRYNINEIENNLNTTVNTKLLNSEVIHNYFTGNIGLHTLSLQVSDKWDWWGLIDLNDI